MELVDEEAVQFFLIAICFYLEGYMTLYRIVFAFFVTSTKLLRNSLNMIYQHGNLLINMNQFVGTFHFLISGKLIGI